MSQTAPEIVRIGVANARVTSVTQQRVEYIDESGQKQFIDLEQCARNWMRNHCEQEEEFCLLPGVSAAAAAAWNLRCVGQRAACSSSSWVEFMNERSTRFEFEAYEAVYTHLLNPLGEAGWYTFDTD
jgi:hypothetical protein